MTRLCAVLAALTSACLSVPPNSADTGADGGATGGDDRSVTGVDAQDALGDGSAAPSVWAGAYAITWALTGGDCSTEDMAADQIALDGELYLAYYSYSGDDCPAALDSVQSFVPDGDTLSVDPLLQLLSCDGLTYDEFPAHPITAPGDTLSAQVTATRRSSSTSAIICTAEYLLSGVRQ